ncbi:MAG: DUF86 domain-containing protein [Ferrimicrobium sp.]
MTRSNRRDAERANDILGAIAKIGRWRSKHNSSDDMFRSAVMRELGVIGEAANALSDEFKERRPEIPWRNIVDLRNVLAHHYWDTAWALIEQILDDELEQLRRSVDTPQRLRNSSDTPEPTEASAVHPDGRCHRWMPRARAECDLPLGHAGGCRRRAVGPKR